METVLEQSYAILKTYIEIFCGDCPLLTQLGALRLACFRVISVSSPFDPPLIEKIYRWKNRTVNDPVLVKHVQQLNKLHFENPEISGTGTTYRNFKELRESQELQEL